MEDHRRDHVAQLPLAGVRVVDLTQAWAGPYGTMFLADWGAEVIQVESRYVYHAGTRGLTARPGHIPEVQRVWSRAYPDWEPGPRPWNRDPSFNGHGRNKIAMTLDLQRPEGIDVFMRLLRISDVVIENNAPDLLDGIGLGYQGLKKLKPDLVMVRMPAYGVTGPYRSYRAWGSHVEGFIGHTWIRSYRDVDPSLKDDVYPSDAVGGLTAAFSLVLALRHRALTGEGQLIETALSESLFPFLGEAFMDHTMNGRVQSAMGNMDISMAPHGVYRCKGEDRWVTIAVGSDEEWEGLCRALGHPEWTSQPAFNNVLGRWNNQAELDRHIEEWTTSMEAREAMERLQAHGVPAGVVQSAREVSRDPQQAARAFFQEVTHPEAGTHSYPGIIGRLSGTPNSIRRPAPCLGEHNGYVYRDLLGYSDREYEEFERSGHIGVDFAPEIYD